VRAYLVRRLLLIVPTLFGVTLFTFLIMQLAPGDPLKMQLQQAGTQGESSTTREAYLRQRKQWNLDKPAVINLRRFRDYSLDARMCARFQGMTDEGLAAELEGLGRGADPEALAFLRGLEIENFDLRLKDPERREDLVKVVRIALQIRLETLADQGVRFLAPLLRDPSSGLPLRIGAIRSLAVCTLGDPFVYTYSRDPDPEETESVVSTWRIWWEREKDKLEAPAPERTRQARESFDALVAEPSRSKILEGMSAFARTDAKFLMEILLGQSSLKQKYVASLALRSWVGKPLRVDVRVGDPEDRVKPVAENWLAYLSSHPARFEPSFLSKSWAVVSDTQYANSLVKLATFDFGRSMLKPYDPVGPKILDAALVSAPIMLLTEAVVYCLAVPLGVLCAVRRGKLQDRLISLHLFLLHSIPPVVMGMITLTFFCFGVFLRIFPMYGLHAEGYEAFPFAQRALDYAWHISLPVGCLALYQMAGLAMYSRTSMLDVINQDYVRTARAKGLAERSVVFKHGLRNALIPVITLFASFIPALLGGSVIIEVLFGIPGMGRLSFESINAKDYNTVMAIIYIDAIIVMLSILLSDLLYVVVDPRISFSRSEASG
jgi:peptide/nickel transport system permease protein